MGKISLNWFAGFTYKLCQYDLCEKKYVLSSISAENIFDQLKNRFDWIKKFSIEESKQALIRMVFIMYYFLQEPRIIKIASCFHSLVISTCHNGELRMVFIMYYFLQEPRIIKIASCFHSLVISTCHNGELLITHPQRPWCSKKIRTTTITAFLISNTVVQNSYSNSTAFNPQSFAPLSWVPGPFNRSTSLWYSILYNL